MSENPISIEALLEHGDFVRGLAKSLIFDENQVDDVVQQTWLAWMKSPPRQSGATRGWLAAVVRNLAYQRHRRESRREKREQAVAPHEAVPSTAEIVERESMRREVVEAALALEPELRDCVVLRYFENLPVADIAQQLQIPQRTAYVRLERGLDAMRRALDGRHRGDRRAWCLGLIPLAVPSKVAAVAASTGGTAAWTWIGGIGMNATTKTIVTASIAALAAIGIFFGSEIFPTSHEPSDAQPQAKSTASATPGFPVSPLTETAETAKGGANPRSVVADLGNASDLGTQVESASVWGLVTDATTKLPLPGLRINAYGVPDESKSRLQSLTKFEEALLREETVTDTQGKYIFRKLPPGFYFLGTPAQQGLSFTLPAVLRMNDKSASGVSSAERTAREAAAKVGVLLSLPKNPRAVVAESGNPEEISFSVMRGSTIKGTVVDEQGHGIPGAQILILPLVSKMVPNATDGAVRTLDIAVQAKRILGGILGEATTGDRGEFHLSGIANMGQILIVHAPGFQAHQEEFSPPSPTSQARVSQILLRRLPRNLRFDGRVVDEKGVPITAANVYLTNPWRGGIMSPAMIRETLPLAERPKQMTDVEGRFSFENANGLDSNSLSQAPEFLDESVLVWAWAEGYSPASSEEFDTQGWPAGGVTITLRKNLPIRGRVLEKSSETPISDASISVMEIVSDQDDSKMMVSTRIRAISGQDGSFLLEGLPQNPALLTVQRKGFDNTEIEIPAKRSDGTVEIRLVKHGWSIPLRVLEAAGSPAMSNPEAGRLLVAAFRKDPSEILASLSNLAVESFEYATMRDSDDYRWIALRDGRGEITVPEEWTERCIWVVLVVDSQQPQMQAVCRDQEVVEFRVGPRGSKLPANELRVLALTPEGKPASQIKATIVLETKPIQNTLSISKATEQGIASLRLPRPGVFDIVLTSPGGAAKKLSGIEIPRPADEEPIKIQFEKEARIVGHIDLHWAKKMLLEKAPKQVQDLDLRVFVSQESGITSESVKPDAEGRFEYGNLLAGQVVLGVISGETVLESRRLTLEAGKTTQISIPESR